MFAVELVMEGSGRDVLPARSVDVGIGGICVRTESIIDGALVRRVRFRLGRKDLEFNVTSRWSSPTGSEAGPLTGFVFDEVDSQSESALWSFIQERASELASFFRTCDGLEDLSFQEAVELALITRLREVEPGQVLYGGIGSEPSASIFALFRGHIVVERASARRQQQVIHLESGQFFGGMPVIAGCAPIDRAVATTSSTVLEFLEYNTRYLSMHKPMLAATLIRATTYHWIQRATRLLDRAFDQISA
jgi:hypothetical protein